MLTVNGVQRRLWPTTKGQKSVNASQVGTSRIFTKNMSPERVVSPSVNVCNAL